MKLESRISNFFFYLSILFLPTQLGRHFWPDFSFVAGVRVDYLSPTIYLTDVFVISIFVFWLIDKVQSSKFKVQSYLSGYLKFVVLVVFVVFLIFGILLSKNQAVGAYGFLKLLEFIFLGCYTARNIKRLNFGTVLLFFSIGIIFESFLSIFQYINQTSIGGIFYYFGERTFNAQTPGIANTSINGELVLRPYGTFSHPNVLAGFLVIAMTLVSSKFKIQNSKLNKTTVVVSLAVGTLALFLTMSRVAILIWLITVGIFLFRKFLNHKSYILILLGVLLVLGLATPLGARFANLALTDESIVVRQQLIKSSLLMIKENPFFGVGLNNFLVELPKFQKINNYFTDLQPVHNIYLLILTQAGVVGLVSFLWFIFKTYQRIMNHESRQRRGSQQATRIKNKKPIIHNFLRSRISLRETNFKFQILSTVLVLGLFDHYFLTLQQGQLFFSFVLGLCWSKSWGELS